MNTDFRIVALERERFAHLFVLPDAQLVEYGAKRMRVDRNPGFPCRVSLGDAAVGESVILVPFTHHDVASPYRAAGPIFVREAAITAKPGPNHVPAMLRHRLLSLRGYDAAGTMRNASVVEGANVENGIREFFSDDAIACIHLHNAKPGCFNCAVQRA